MLLNKSSYKQNATYNDVIKLAQSAIGKDAEGYRAEFIRLAKSAQLLAQTETSDKASKDT